MFESINLEASEKVMIAAVILGPILAVQIQKLLESTREKRQRRMALFQTLMSTRAERLHREHVKALNMIDIEFYGRNLPLINTRYQNKKEQAVTHAWKSYNSHLNSKQEFGSDEHWVKKGDELFTELLYTMSQALNYDYDKVQLARDCYRPVSHWNLENTTLEIMDGLAGVLSSKKAIPMYVVNLSSAPPGSSTLDEPAYQPATASTDNQQ